MASISLPLQPQPASSLPHYFDSVDRAPNRHRRNKTMSTPLPNPPFVFPAQAPGEADNNDLDTTTSDRPVLPAFSFNPGSTDSSQPPAPAPPAKRMSGHRRQYSEFVGGDQMVAPEDTAASQTNAEESAAPAKLPPPGPGFSAGNRRRHAHRRSAAISSVDLTAISNALDLKPNVESAPCTSTDSMRERRPSHEPPPVPPLPHSATGVYRSSPPASPQLTVDAACSSSQSPANLPSSTSGVSNEGPAGVIETQSPTQSDISARKSDPAISFKNGSPNRPQKSRPRPRTADASLMLELSNGMTENSSASKRPRSAAGHSRSHKSLSSGLITSAFRRSHIEDDGFFPPSRQSSDDDSDNADETNEMSGSPSSLKKRTKSKKRQKKVRSWAGSLLIRGKSKSHDSKKDGSNGESKEKRPPALTRTNSDYGSGLDVAFDDDSIVVIRTPTHATHPDSQQTPSEAESYASLEDSWKPRSFYEQTTATPSDGASPVIDLDAALGPFNTPDLRSGQPPETGFSAATKRMYSGGRRGEFVGPEMRYHRRAESAPEMPPFDRAFLGSQRFPTSSSLENPDVFYEEEEDAFLAATSDSGNDEEHFQEQIASTEIKDMVSKDNKSENSGDSSDTLTGRPTSETARPENTGLGIQGNSDGVASAPVPFAQDLFKPSEQRFYSAQAPALSTPFSGRPKTPLEIGKPGEWQSRMPYPPSPEVSPRFLPADHRPMTSPNELSALPPFSLHGGCSLPNSSYPSPDFTVSSEAPRSITTASTDPFPHASIEDVPSLTSSTSTMTNTLNRMSATFFHARPRLSTDRSASLSAAVHRRSSQPSSKRASLASLSKLMVGPHAERSKLSHEEKPPGDEPEKAKKKGRRISRLMHFWRAKDKERPNEPTAQD